MTYNLSYKPSNLPQTTNRNWDYQRKMQESFGYQSPTEFHGLYGGSAPKMIKTQTISLK